MVLTFDLQNDSLSRYLLIYTTLVDLIDIMNEDTDFSYGHGNSQSKSDICGRERDQ
jgi:hypothetical protein